MSQRSHWSISTNHSKLKLQPLGWYWRTRMCLWIPLRHGDFRLKKIFSSDCLDHWASGIALITKSRCLTCPPRSHWSIQTIPTRNSSHLSDILETKKNVPPNPRQTWRFQAKKDPLQRRAEYEQRRRQKGSSVSTWKSKAHRKTCLSVCPRKEWNWERSAEEG